MPADRQDHQVRAELLGLVELEPTLDTDGFGLVAGGGDDPALGAGHDGLAAQRRVERLLDAGEKAVGVHVQQGAVLVKGVHRKVGWKMVLEMDSGVRQIQDNGFGLHRIE